LRGHQWPVPQKQARIFQRASQQQI
jgi:hypothetical protein